MVAAYAAEIGAIYLETSAKDDFHVQDIFVNLSKRFVALFCLLCVTIIYCRVCYFYFFT